MHQTLYRKYRPQNFDEVAGQAHITDTLKQAIKKNSWSHAYIFAGPRGTGKTSIARIFAKEIGTKPVDIYEIDAASNRGIDDIRSIRDSVATLPFESKKKVYIIDEAHMLTKEAWNALLKTLEEPPEHVQFIFATTEIEKIPDTILSRCETFHVKKPDTKTLSDVLLSAVKNEGYSIDKEALRLITLLGDGSFRDAYGILQKVISSIEGEKIALSHIESVTSAPRMKVAYELLSEFSEGSVTGVLAVLESCRKAGVSEKIFSQMFFEAVRSALVLRLDKNTEKKLEEELSEESLEILRKASKSKRVNSGALLRLLQALSLTGTSALAFAPLEAGLIDLLVEEK